MPTAANVLPQDLMNTAMSKVFDIINNGDGQTVPKSQDNFFAWASPGMPFDPADFEFLAQGLTGVYKPQTVTNPDGTTSTAVLTEEQRDAELARTPAGCTSRQSSWRASST